MAGFQVCSARKKICREVELKKKVRTEKKKEGGLKEGWVKGFRRTVDDLRRRVRRLLDFFKILDRPRNSFF